MAKNTYRNYRDNKYLYVKLLLLLKNKLISVNIIIIISILLAIAMNVLYEIHSICAIPKKSLNFILYLKLSY